MNLLHWAWTSGLFDRTWLDNLLIVMRAGFVAIVSFGFTWWLFDSFKWPRLLLEGIVRVLRSADILLVRWGSYPVGIRFAPRPRHIWFAALFVLAIAGVVLSSPAITAGFLAFGLIFILVTLRNWSHDEDEKREVVPPHEKIIVRTSSDDEFRYEAAWSIVLLLIIAPVGFAKLDRVYHLFPDPDGLVLIYLVNLLGRHVIFAWFELTHAVPLVHVVMSIFYEGPASIAGKMTTELKWALLGLRLIYELLVVTAIIDLVRVGMRIARREDLRPMNKALKSDDVEEWAWAVRELGKLARRFRPDALTRLIEIRDSNKQVQLSDLDIGEAARPPREFEYIYDMMTRIPLGDADARKKRSDWESYWKLKKRPAVNRIYPERIRNLAQAELANIRLLTDSALQDLVQKREIIAPIGAGELMQLQQVSV